MGEEEEEEDRMDVVEGATRRLKVKGKMPSRWAREGFASSAGWTPKSLWGQGLQITHITVLP